MSTPRSTPRGPAGTTAEIAERAWRGTVASAIFIPVLQLILLELAGATYSMNNAALSSEPQSIIYTAIFVLGLLPIVSTIVATAIAYLGGGLPGVGLYYIMSIGASMILGAALTGVLIFMTGVALFLVVATIKSRQNRNRSTYRPIG